MYYKDMNFFDEIKRLCKIRGITVDELMKMIGKTGIPVYAGWRQRGCYPRADDFHKICNVLEVSMEHFFDNDKGIVVSDRMMNLVKKLDSLTEEDVNTLNNLTITQLKNLLTLAKSMQS